MLKSLLATTFILLTSGLSHGASCYVSKTQVEPVESVIKVAHQLLKVCFKLAPWGSYVAIKDLSSKKVIQEWVSLGWRPSTEEKYDSFVSAGDSSTIRIALQKKANPSDNFGFVSVVSRSSARLYYYLDSVTEEEESWVDRPPNILLNPQAFNR